MKKSTTGIIIGALGIGLLAGGSTFALWQDTAAVQGGVITAGNLDVELVGAQKWQDVSPEKAAKAIDISTFRTVPGDKLKLTQDIKVTLTGDNIKGDLTVTPQAPAAGSLLAASSAPDAELGRGVTLSYALLDGATVIASGTNTGSAVYSKAFDAALSASKTYTLEVTAAFDNATPSQVRANATASLANLDVKLAQKR